MKRKFYLILYYGFARFLPVSYFKFGGKLSKKIRYNICKHIFKKCGNNVNVERMAYFGGGANLVIGDNSGLGINCHVHPNTIIGNDVMMGPNVYMLDGNTHNFGRVDITMIEQGMKPISERAQVEIGNDCWIGRDVMILGSRHIEDGCIIGARCVLTKDFPEYSIIGGNPSKLLKSRLGKY